MKIRAPRFLAIALVISFGCFGQTSGPSNFAESESRFNFDDPRPAYYHVEERINSKFGSRVTTYVVPRWDMINHYDLGPGNKRIITPKYSKKAEIPAPVQMHGNDLALSSDSPVISAPVPMIASPAKTETVVEEKKPVYAYIGITDTYERILNRGYRSIDMLKRVANSRFFDGDLKSAAKWYAELFTLTEDLDEAYYYRYATALKSVSQIDKANEMMAKFEGIIARNK